MATGAVLRRDWFVALVFALLFLVASINGVGFLERLEYRAYDVGLRAARPKRFKLGKWIRVSSEGFWNTWAARSMRASMIQPPHMRMRMDSDLM